MTLALVDACGANISSVLAALRRLGCEPVVTRDAEVINSAERVILPGVGAASDAMRRLREHRLEELIPQLQQPVLGICVGMQVLFAGSEEGDCDCLDIVGTRLLKIKSSTTQPVPHMGWNRIECSEHPLLHGLGAEPWCYFVHSYASPVIDQTIASCHYGDSFSAAIASKNFHGVQFHPERSSDTGSRVLQNFLQLT